MSKPLVHGVKAKTLNQGATQAAHASVVHEQVVYSVDCCRGAKEGLRGHLPGFGADPGLAPAAPGWARPPVPLAHPGLCSQPQLAATQLPECPELPQSLPAHCLLVASWCVPGP